MIDQNIQKEIEEMIAFFGSEVIDDPKKLCEFIHKKSTPYIASIENKALFDAFQKLEDISGAIPFFSFGDKLSEEVRKDKMLYYFQEIIDFIGPLFLAGLKLINYTKIEINEENRKIIKSIELPNQILLNAYVREWETYKLQFVEPIYKKLQSKGLVPKKQKENQKEGKSFYIRVLKEYFGKDKDFKLITPILDYLNTPLRNSIVHLDFIVNDKENRLYYYDSLHWNEPHKIRYEDLNSIGILEICEKVIMLYIIRGVIGVYVCEKMI